MQECEQGVNPAHWEASLAKEREPWWQGLVPPLRKYPWHSPHWTNTKYDSKWVFSSYTLHTVFYQCYDGPTKCSNETKTIPSDRAVAQCYIQVSYITRECSYWQGSGPMLSVYIMWPHWKETSSTSVIPWKWWRNQVFSKIFCTHTHILRLVSPWGCPGTYPIAQYTAYPSGGCPMARDCPTVPPAYPTFRNRHTHGTQHTQHSRKALGATQTARLQDCKHSQPTESITKRIQRSPTETDTEKSPAEAIQRKAWQRGKV